MLFKRLYNWIKYKTLPPSFLFKNRLFIERDSKHRRVMSNFGLSFRNSKWSNYETYNIKSNFRTNFLNNLYFFLYSLFMGLVCYYGHGYYLENYEFNRYAIPFWSTIDTIDYYLTFFIWLIASIGSIISNTLYSYFFFNNFSLRPQKTPSSPNTLFNKYTDNSSFENKDLFVSKHDLNWVLYSWLTNSNSKKNAKILENLFNSNLNSHFWNSNYDVFLKLYKVSYLINLSNSQSSFFTHLVNQNKTLNFLNLSSYFNNSIILENRSDTFFYYFLKNNKNYFTFKNTNFITLNLLKNKNEWNLYNFDKEFNNYSFLIKNKLGLFFFDDFNYQKFSYLTSNFNELWFLNSSFKNQLNAGKWNRWLYRYSILHRKILKNSHKLTLAKRLINSGFYDSKIFNKNIWATEHLAKITSSQNFSSFFNSYYNFIYNSESRNYNNTSINLNGNGSQLESLSLLNFYENSYFWYLKRFYLFNTIPNNIIKSKNQLNSSLLSNVNQLNLNKDNSLNKHLFFLTYLLNSNSLNLANYSHSINFLSEFKTPNFFFTNNNLEKNFYNLKDIYLNTNENDILNKDNLNLIYWITSNSSKNNNVLFFDYLNNNYYSKIFLTNNKIFVNNKNYNTWLIYSLINFDNFFLNDALYLSLFS